MFVPQEYVDYLNGGGLKEGVLNLGPGWFQLWPHHAIEERNHEYNIPERLPGFVGFGSNGGGELLAFDSCFRIFMIPMIVMAPSDAKLVANSWAEFLEKIET